jgi:hypothetical protein
MKTKRKLLLAGAIGATLALSLRAGGQSFDLSWNTIDGGGGMNSAAGAFSLSGTIGQGDAQTPPVMSGGLFSLIGGFWPGTSVVCTCPGDMNGDALRNGLDIRQFVQCITAGGACGCAEVDGEPGMNMGDVAAFVNDLLAGTTCP